ncbi:adenosylcobinamide-phosphate synthase CbiB [Fuchsiella alkaliacetigena]|uniref:adenosylcobinamide-phosphate synthase CbiB n=1 Tax=Fuchsiella alkaliacetigena TaxID=957042 RepID=UPI00200AB42E|nr:adenosylcobinamide-phosphate synthase CbiB [Fuchsiella alkaliacetigena]MCK8825518.1 adenosylcobinamide-phosphate synthase CbiB [Fuchsiella alkaliacetigena]
MFNESVIIILLALLVDLVVGDPEFLPHPVQIIGKFIDDGEQKLRELVSSELGERLAGLLLALTTILLTWISTYFLIMLIRELYWGLYMVVSILLLSTTFSVKGLAGAAKEIYRYLAAGELGLAREKVGWIVGRDTEGLSSTEVVRATVETVAENTVDGVLSPIFFACLGGVPLAMTYKAVNTLDSMLGYKNEDYLYFGWAAARIDDLANWIPARISGLLLSLAAFFLKRKGLASLKMVFRDAKKHPSPNGGYPEAAVAGALGVRLGGTNYYQGQASFREYLGDDNRVLENQDIRDTIYLMYITTFLFVLSYILLVLGYGLFR